MREMISIRIGRGTAIHSGIKRDGTIVGAICGADCSFRVGGAKQVTAEITCKRCLKMK